MKQAALIASGLLASSFVRAADRSEIPLPPDLAISVPASATPPAFKAFSGAWGFDDWSGKLPHRLIVERVNPDGSAQVVYALGGTKGSWVRDTGQISQGALHLSFPSGAKVQYSFLPDGTLWGIYSRDAAKAYVYLQHVPDMSARTPQFLQDQLRDAGETVMIPVTSHLPAIDGKVFQLKSTVYRSRLPGNRPLIIFNHGSAEGISPGLSFDFRDTALFLRSLGFTVVVPMRKGRGGSEGPYLETESQPPDQQLEAGLEDVVAVQAYFKAQPSIDSAHVIVAGQSRGGLLAVAYAARHPHEVVGVMNFSGGWYGERVASDFNFSEIARAGRSAGVPMLWFYSDHDRYYSLDYAHRLFDAFHAAGGHGELVELHVRETNNGHFAFGQPDYWNKAVQAYLESRVTSPALR